MLKYVAFVILFKTFYVYMIWYYKYIKYLFFFYYFVFLNKPDPVGLWFISSELVFGIWDLYNGLCSWLGSKWPVAHCRPISLALLLTVELAPWSIQAMMSLPHKHP